MDERRASEALSDEDIKELGEQVQKRSLLLFDQMLRVSGNEQQPEMYVSLRAKFLHARMRARA